MGGQRLLEAGRQAFTGRSWREARDAFLEADSLAPLTLDDLERLGACLELSGDYDGADATRARAYRDALRLGDPHRATRSAFWLAVGLMTRGEMAQAGGWLVRAQRLVRDFRAECPEQGYVLIPAALQRLFGGDPGGALPLFETAASLGERFAETDLTTLGRLGAGQARVDLGDREAGVPLLDDAMVAVTSGETSPIIAGVVYCVVIEICHRIFDLRRATEWTAALDRWCESQPDLMPFRGECRLYRSELFRLHGDWGGAMDEAREAYARLAAPPPRASAGSALYQQAELHRLRGEVEAAEGAYREAARRGHPPEPGLAYLRLAQGNADAALQMISRALEETRDDSGRARLLGAYSEIAVSVGDLESARAAVDELNAIAARFATPLLEATAATAEGALRVALGEHGDALAVLRRASARWLDLDAPYEAARTRIVLGAACRALGDPDGGDLELAAARETLEELGAAPDLAHLRELLRTAPTASTQESPLTQRELEVLRLVASGMTNRAIALELVISEKTVARHVSNIFAKLDLPSRAAATAYAYAHRLV